MTARMRVPVICAWMVARKSLRERLGRRRRVSLGLLGVPLGELLGELLEDMPVVIQPLDLLSP